MPLPTPTKGESQDAFVERCMSDDVMKSDYEDNKQRLAVCFSQWKKSKEKKSIMGIERRYIPLEEFRYDEDGNKISGYAAVFDTWSENLGFFKEKISRGAFKKTIKDGADVRALFNHDPNYVLGRTANGTLELKEDKKGLHFDNKLPDTQYARDLRELIRRGDITQNSFGFKVVKDAWNEKGDERTLLEVNLYDVSPVTFPAYPQTEVKLRALLQEEGIDYDSLEIVIQRINKQINLTNTDIDVLRSTISVLEKYLPKEEPTSSHSDIVIEPVNDFITLVRMREMERKVKSVIGA